VGRRRNVRAERPSVMVAAKNTMHFRYEVVAPRDSDTVGALARPGRQNLGGFESVS